MWDYRTFVLFQSGKKGRHHATRRKSQFYHPKPNKTPVVLLQGTFEKMKILNSLKRIHLSSTTPNFEFNSFCKKPEFTTAKNPKRIPTRRVQTPTILSSHTDRIQYFACLAPLAVPFPKICVNLRIQEYSAPELILIPNTPADDYSGHIRFVHAPTDL